MKLALLWLQLLMLLPCLAGAQPYTPQRDDEIVERLPQRLGSAAERAAARQQRAALRQAPQQLTLALPLAEAAIRRFRESGDPRELGQAQAALAPWWTEAAPPPGVRLLRALVRQSQHDFPTALTDLDHLLADTTAALPLRAQAELSRAALLQVQGRWRDTAAGCAQLAGPRYAALGSGVRLHGAVCAAEIDSLQGRDAAAALNRLAQRPGAPQAWIALIRAEAAERRGQAAAEPLFKQALAAHPDIYTRAALADWLIAAKRWPEAAAVLLAYEPRAAQDTADLPDALLLRLAIAWRLMRDPRAPTAAADLQSRFDAASQRGDSSHGRERARFHLDVQPDAALALKEARANWAVQKEPADALLLVRAARAAGQPAAADPVWQFARANGLADVRLGSVP